MTWREQVLKYCTVANAMATTMSPEEFANARREGIGASDASVILGTNPWADLNELIEDKIATGVTAKNLEVAGKASVRKGIDLEPLVLKKAEELLGTPVYKPEDMYRIAGSPWLTVNYDGLAWTLGQWMPVEAKTVTQFGEKQWNWAKSWQPAMTLPYRFTSVATDPKERCEQASAHYGIPPYYYCQLQQQMLGCGATMGLMAALHDKDWTLRLYLVHRDDPLIQTLIERSMEFWNKHITPYKGTPRYEIRVMQVEKSQLAEEDY